MTSNFTELKTEIQQIPIDFSASGAIIFTQLNLNGAISESSEISHWKLFHYSAVESWLLDYHPKPDASNLEKVRGYLEAFHHLCQVENWELARTMLLFSPSLTQKKLHEQLGTWGYYQEQIELYHQLLDKLNLETNCILLQGLGTAYCFSGDPQTAMQYYQRALKIACETQNAKAEAQAHGGLGKVYTAYTKQDEIALIHYQQQLEIALIIKDREQEGMALEGLGSAYGRLGQFQTSIKIFHQALKVAREIGDSEIKLLNLTSLYSNYIEMEQGNRDIISLLQQQLEISRQANNLRSCWVILNNIGNAYYLLKDYQNSIKFFQEALEIIREIGDRFGEIITLNGLGATYSFLGQHQAAIDCHFPALIISHQIGDRYMESNISSNLSYCYGCLKQHQKAIRYSKLALNTARRLNNKILQKSALATLANAYWHRGNYVLGLVLIARSLLMRPWQSGNSKVIFEKASETIKESLQRLFHVFSRSAQLK